MTAKKNKTQIVSSKKHKNNKKIVQDTKKYSKHFEIFIGIILLALVAISLFAFITRNQKNESGQKVNVYFLNSATKKLEPELRTVDGEDNVKLVSSILDEFIAGPKSVALLKTLPDDVKIEEVLLPINSDVAEVQFSENYKDMPVNQELYCRAALVWTLTEFDFINQVHIYVGDKELTKTNGDIIGLLNRDNILIDSDIKPDFRKEEKIKLYFADKEGLGLEAEERIIEISTSQTLEKYIVEEIIKGPKNKELLRTIPQETKIIDISTDENICYVDLNSDFITKFVGGSTAERLAVYSIVNSLTELQNVKKVLFLIDGSKVSDIQGHLMDISAPFERDESMILD